MEKDKISKYLRSALALGVFLAVTLLPIRSMSFTVCIFSLSKEFMFLLFLFLLFCLLLRYDLSHRIVKRGNNTVDLFFNIIVDNAYISVTILSLLSVVASFLIFQFIFEGIPHVQDAIAQLFQAKIFSLGKLYVEPHPLKEFFSFLHIIDKGNKWYSLYPPVFPFLVMLGYVLHTPGIVNPLLGGITVLIVYKIGEVLFNRRVGIIAVILLVSSPFFYFMNASMMVHPLSLLLTSSFFLLFILADKKDNYKYFSFSGITLGLLFSSRPYDAFLIGIPILVYLVFNSFKYRNWENLTFFIFSFFPSASIIFIYNYFTNGNIFNFGYYVWDPYYAKLGFILGHTPLRGLLFTLSRLRELNYYLFILPVPSLIFILIALIGRKIKENKYLLMMAFEIITVFVGFFFYHYYEICYGPRLIYSTLVFIVIISALGIERISHNFYWKKTKAIIIGLLCFFYFRINLPLYLEYYKHSYWGVNREVHEATKKNNIHNAVVFFNYHGARCMPHYKTREGNLWGAAFMWNSPLLDSDVIFARDLGEHNKDLMNFYPHREFYICYYDCFIKKFVFRRIQRG